MQPAVEQKQKEPKFAALAVLPSRLWYTQTNQNPSLFGRLRAATQYAVDDGAGNSGTDTDAQDAGSDDVADPIAHNVTNNGAYDAAPDKGAYEVSDNVAYAVPNDFSYDVTDNVAYDVPDDFAIFGPLRLMCACVRGSPRYVPGIRKVRDLCKFIVRPCTVQAYRLYVAFVKYDKQACSYLYMIVSFL